LCCFSHAQSSPLPPPAAAAAASGKTRRGIPHDVTITRQGEYRDVITAKIKFKVDIRLRGTARRDFMQQTAVSSHYVVALPRDTP